MEEINARRKRASLLYYSGYSLREVAKIEAMSHEWVRLAIKSYPQEEGVDSNLEEE